MAIDLAKLREMDAKATPAPWSACGSARGGCQCCTVMAPDFPIAKATSGKWGDRYPSLRLVDKGGFEKVAEAYIELIDYGEVSEEWGKANAAFIAEMRNALPELLTLAERAQRCEQALREAANALALLSNPFNPELGDNFAADECQKARKALQEIER